MYWLVCTEIRSKYYLENFSEGHGYKEDQGDCTEATPPLRCRLGGCCWVVQVNVHLDEKRREEGHEGQVEGKVVVVVSLDPSQAWSLTKFYSVDFSKSRIDVKKWVFNKYIIKV